MLSIARRLLGELTGPAMDADGRGDPAVVLRAAAGRALERVRRGKGPAPFTGDERVLLHAAALPALVAAQGDDGPGVSRDRVDELVEAVSSVLTSRFGDRVQHRLRQRAHAGGAADRDLADAATVDLLKLAVRAATCTPRAETEDDGERELLEEFFSTARPSPDVLDALAGCYLQRGDLHAAANVRAARELIVNG